MNPIPLALLLFPPTSAAPQGGIVGDPQPNDVAPYEELTDDLVEVTNFHPEPFAGIAIDSAGAIHAVNPYNSTWVKYASPTATTMAVRAPTGHNPVSIGIWDRGELEDRVVVVCAGSHAAFLHSPSGEVLDVVRLDSEPADLVIDEEEKWAFVSCRGSNTVVKIALDTFTVVDRYPIDCGVRPGPLWLEGEGSSKRLYVAPMVTGNNSTFTRLPDTDFGEVLDLIDELPDEDVHRIDPSLSGEAAVTPAVKNAGSLIFDVGRHPGNADLWILSSESINKDPALNTEPLLKGRFVINRLKLVAGVNATSSAVVANDGLDLDDHDSNPLTDYDADESLAQARALAFQADGDAFVGGPSSEVLAELDASGARTMRYELPPNAQCYALATYGASTVLALCLGTMTIEVFTEGIATPGTPLPLGNDPTPEHVRKGRDIVLDASRSLHGRFTCFSCHEGGRTDMLGWSLSAGDNDRKDVMLTQSLLSIADTFPHHWRGERDLVDFRKAWEGLLGAAPPNMPDGADGPDEHEMQDVIAFFHSLKAPANPKQNPRRVVDNSVDPSAPNGMPGLAVSGQQMFENRPNFNANTCSECHSFTTGSNANMFAEVGSFVPRVQEVEVAHLRQLQHRSLETVALSSGQVVNVNGWGASHNGFLPSVFEFIFQSFDQLTAVERVNIFKFVEQFDQGIAPGVHWATWLDDGSPANTPTKIQNILIASSESGWLDVVAWGKFRQGGTWRDVRWLYDPVQDLFLNDHPLVANKTFAALASAASAGDARLAFMGAPLGNGYRIAFDPDADDLGTETELRIGTDPWNPDSDGDDALDGYEFANSGDPKDDEVLPWDQTFPLPPDSSLQFVTARSAKYHIRFSEDVRYEVEYKLLNESDWTRTFAQDDYVRTDTFVLTHSNPSRPNGVPNTPDPDVSAGVAVDFEARITMWDRSEKKTGPLMLSQTFTPLAAQVQQIGSIPWPFMHVAEIEAHDVSWIGSTLEATIQLSPAFHYLDVDSTSYWSWPAVVACSIAKLNPEGDWEWSDDFIPLSGTFVDEDVDLFLKDTVPPIGGNTEWDALPTPFMLAEPPQQGTGPSEFRFRQGGLAPGQKVKVIVQAILLPTEVPLVFEDFSVFLMQPLQTEDAHEFVIEF